ncbi:MAG: TlpA family protein disulfide reductase [Eubacterium sp.]|nr:TlpA family protein disulfide reductase [Eubacterium sp.]
MEKMKKISILTACVFISMACLIMAFTAGCSAGGSASDGGAAEDEEAPDFTAELMGGGKFTLSEHNDDVLLINFWATWCGYCVEEMPELDKLNKDNIEGLEIILVDCGEPAKVVNDFIKDSGYTFSVAYDEDGSIESKYPSSGIPYTVIVKDGKIMKTFVGMPQDPYNTYKKAVEELL